MILHPLTARAVDGFLSKPSHGLLIIGEEGAGKLGVALMLAQSILCKNILEADSTFRHVRPQKGVISIEQVRELQKFLHLKTTGSSQIRRVIIIEDAHAMTHEAQNALLKILEEPPSDTIIILTAIPSRNVLPTIYSRTQQLPIKTASLEDTIRSYSEAGFAKSQIEKAYFLSNGQQGLLKALLEQKEGHELVDAITLAKSILSKNKFERLAMVDELSKQKASIPGLIKALKRIARAALIQAAQQNKEAQGHSWHTVLLNVQEAEMMLIHSPNSKLLLTNLMLKI